MPRGTARITLPERYRVVRHIANGGMASVWEAHDELLDRSVAVKVLAGHLSEDDRARRRFAREARAAAGLSSHPHVVTIYDVAEHDGRSFIVMELLTGGTLADRLRADADIPHRVALRWLGEAASALDEAHSRGIVHRDIKPANLLLDDRERLAIADFGIARLGLEDQITQTGQVLGTAAYISPEQAMGEPATPASDRYALAIVAFELLSGAKPYTGDNFAAQARQHVEQDPPAASERSFDVPPAVDPVLQRGMAKDPDARWESSAAMVRALDDALGPAPARRRAPRADSAPTRPLDERPPLPPRAGGRATGGHGRGRGAVAIAAVAALLLLAAGAFAVFRGDGDDGGEGGREPTTAQQREPDRTRTPEATPDRTATPEPTRTAEPTPEPTETPTPEPTETPTPEATEEPATTEVAGEDPTELQLEAYRLNQAGEHEQALAYAEKAVALCEGSSEISPCAYALYELARARRLTGDPQGAIAALKERRRRFPGDQAAAVAQELQLARQAARGQSD